MLSCGNPLCKLDSLHWERILIADHFVVSQLGLIMDEVVKMKEGRRRVINIGLGINVSNPWRTCRGSFGTWTGATIPVLTSHHFSLVFEDLFILST